MENKLLIEAITAWRAVARARRLGIEVEIETEHFDATEQITFAPTALVDFDWWEEFVGDLPPTVPKKIIRKSKSRITYRTSKEHTITERAVAWPTDRWGRPYRPWDGPPKGGHVLHWSDFDSGPSGMVLDFDAAEEIAEQHS
jgi:hypothetical protein